MEHTGHGLVERRIAEALEHGDFDHLPGRGAPLPGLTGYDPPDWWAREWLERERVSARKRDIASTIERAVLATWFLPDEGAVRQEVTRINAYVEAINRRLPDIEHLPTIDIGETIHAWRAAARARTPASD